MLKIMNSQEIRKLYKEGIRDFRNIKGQFVLNDTDLTGCDFSGSDIFGSTFWGANLTNTNFSNCKMEWIEMSFSNLTNANFTGAKLKWGAMNYCNIKNTDFSKAEIRRFSFYGTPVDTAKLIGAVVIHCFRHENELTLKDVKEMLDNMRSAGLPDNAITNVELVYDKGKKIVEEDGDLHFGFNKKKGLYILEGGTGYISSDENMQTYAGGNLGSYGSSSTVGESYSDIKGKKKKDSYEK